jgi:hypothetical protein
VRTSIKNSTSSLKILAENVVDKRREGGGDSLSRRKLNFWKSLVSFKGFIHENQGTVTGHRLYIQREVTEYR